MLKHLLKFVPIQTGHFNFAHLQDVPFILVWVYDKKITFMTFHDLPWHFLTFYDLPQLSMTFYHLTWPYISYYDLWSNVRTFLIRAQINSHLYVTPKLVPINSESSIKLKSTEKRNKSFVFQLRIEKIFSPPRLLVSIISIFSDPPTHIWWRPF